MSKYAIPMLLVLTASVSMAGLPTKRVVWSPDGRMAAVLGGDGLRLCDDNGKLSKVVAINVDAADWMPDSSHLIVAHTIKVKTWKELEPLIPTMRKLDLQDDATRFLRSISPVPSIWTSTQPTSKPAISRDGGLRRMMRRNALRGASFEQQTQMELLYLLQKYEHVLADVAGVQWKEIKSRIAARITAFALVTVDPKSGRTDIKTIGKSLDKAVELSIAPGGKVFAWSSVGYGTYGVKTYDRRVSVMSTDGANSHTLGMAQSTIAWGPEGRTLYSIEAPEESMPMRVGLVVRDKVCGANGKLLKRPQGNSLVYLLIRRSALNIGTTPDGGVIFPSIPASMPGTTFADKGGKQYIHAVDRLFLYVHSRNVNEQLLPDRPYEKIRVIDRFQVSPDGKKLLVIAHSHLAVIWIETGNLLGIVGQTLGIEARNAPGTLFNRMTPVWRGNDEICFAATYYGEGASKNPEVVLCQLPGKPKGVKAEDLKTTIISRKWPKSVRTKFLGNRKIEEWEK